MGGIEGETVEMERGTRGLLGNYGKLRNFILCLMGKSKRPT